MAITPNYINCLKTGMDFMQNTIILEKITSRIQVLNLNPNVRL